MAIVFRLLPALAVLGLFPPAAAEADMPALSIEVDHARVLKVPRPAATVIIGNPAIVDVSVQDATTLVLTGRSYGITNLIILDGQGEAILDESVGVKSFEAGTVRIYRQAARQTLACTPECEPTVTIGDNEDGFDRAVNQFTQRQNLAISATK